ncbi:MAG: DUF2723 domain-containing protein [Dehalococcoidia bacterium]
MTRTDRTMHPDTGTQSNYLTNVLHGHRVGFIAFGVGVITFLFFCLTLAPGLTWSNSAQDGGDLLTAAFTWGIPHPTGYPTYLIGLRAFSFAIPFGDPALHGNLFSAFTASVSVGLLFMVTVKILRKLDMSDSINDRFVLISAGISSLSVTASRMFWSQSTVTEVYALNAMFVSAIALAVLGLRDRQQVSSERPESKGAGWFYTLATGLLSGLAIGNHLTIAALIVPMVIWGLLGNRIRKLAIRNFLSVAAGGLLGLSIYAYAPLASTQSPVINWGHPDSFQGFWWMISGTVYQGYTFDVWGEELFHRVVTSTDHLLAQFGFIGVLLGLVGFTRAWRQIRSLLTTQLISASLILAYAVTYRTADSFLYLIPIFMLFSIWISAGILRVLSNTNNIKKSLAPLLNIGPRTIAGLTILIVILTVPLFSIITNYSNLNLSNDRDASEYAHSAFDTMEPESIVIARTDKTVFSLWYQAYIADRQHAVMPVSAPHIVFDWYWDDLVTQYPNRMPENRPEGLQLRVLAIIEHNLGINSIYEADAPAEAFPELQLVDDGVLKRFIPG